MANNFGYVVGQTWFNLANSTLYCWNGTQFVIAVPAGGSGTVTSVTFTGDGIIDSSTPSTAVTASGTLTATAKTQTANLVLAGPTTGSAAAPTFRSLVAADLPAGVGGYVNLASAVTLTNATASGGIITPTTGSATITIANIPQTYTNLEIVINGSNNTTSSYAALTAQFNGDTAAAYDDQIAIQTAGIWTDGATSGAATSLRIALIGGTANPWGGGKIIIPFYSKVMTDHFFTSSSFVLDNSGVLNNWINSGYYNGSGGSAAITSIVFGVGGNFAAGTTLTIHGVL